MLVNRLKIGNEIREQFELKEVSENGTMAYSVPENLDTLKKCAYDTLDWEVGQKVKAVAGQGVQLSTVNSKMIILLAKIVNKSNPKLDSLTDLEKELFNNMLDLANTDYTDSELANNTIKTVKELLSNAMQKATRIAQAKTIEAVIEILNEDS